MREHPVLFNAEMVRAVLDGSKTQTRRVIKPSVYGGFIGGAGEENDPAMWGHEDGHGEWQVLARGLDGRGQYGSSTSIPCPYGVPGDRLWVRETWRVMDLAAPQVQAQIMWEASNARRWVDVCDTESRTASEWIEHLRASEHARAAKSRRYHQGRPSIHMPRWASRILLEVTDVRVERVQDISEADARAEGVSPRPTMGSTTTAGADAREIFAVLWNGINEKRGFGWAENPWVWVVVFRVLEVSNA